MEDNTKHFHSNEGPVQPLPVAEKGGADEPLQTRRKGVKAACEACQKRKSKCSGGRPNCAICVARGTSCVYDTDMSDETHAQALKRNYDQLRRSNTAHKEIFEFLQARPETEAEELFRRIRSGTDAETLLCQVRADYILSKASPEPKTQHQYGLPSIAEFSTSMLRHDDPNHRTLYKSSKQSGQDEQIGAEEDVGHDLDPSKPANPQQTFYEHSPTRNDEPISPPCFNHLVSWKLTPSFSDGNLVAENTEQLAILSLPPLPLDAYTSHSYTNMWTRTGWTSAHILHLFDVLFTWDYLPFSFLCYDLFLQDFHSGSTEFCSSALVHAVLALAIRIVNENDDDLEILPSGWLSSKPLFNEAKAKVQSSGLLKDLPDIQALGMLSLYEIRCGQEVKAQELAEAFVYNIKELCQRQAAAGKELEQYAKVRTTTYCGAVSLSRMLRITTGRLFTEGDHTPQEDIPILDKLSDRSTETSQGNNKLRSNLAITSGDSELPNLQVISVKIFQLTEWVYKFARLAPSDSQRAPGDLRTFYMKCLEWYESVLALLNADGNRTPFALFVHMYYHMCLLYALRPFVGLTTKDSDRQPRKICRQAAQSILALAQCYDDLFTLRRVSGLIPYFVCASGLYGLAMEGGSSRMNPVHLRVGYHPPGIQIKANEYESAVRHFDALPIPPYIKVSASVHAHRLLAKIASTHSAAMVAAKML